MEDLIKIRLEPTFENHSDFVDSFAYGIAVQEMKVREGYILLHIKQKPRWLPKFVWHWLLGKLLHLNEFRSKYLPLTNHHDPPITRYRDRRMKLEDQVCSLELAKKLKELGAKQESYFYWKHITKSLQGLKVYDVDRWVITDYGTRTGELNSEYHYSAFTVAELGEMLYGVSVKWLLHDQYQDQYLVLEFYLREIRLVNNKTRKLERREIADTEVDARAKMLIYLIENKLISITN